MMKLSKIGIFVAVIALLLAYGCTQEGTVDYREKEYGYVQFKLYKAASYSSVATTSSRATVVEELDYLGDACKVEVNITDANNRTIRQSLVLSSANSEVAEFGLRSAKLKLLAGEYRLGMITLFDVEDAVIYRKVPTSELQFTVVAGGLTQHDVTIDVTPRGSVKFTLIKDLSDFHSC